MYLVAILVDCIFLLQHIIKHIFIKCIEKLEIGSMSEPCEPSDSSAKTKKQGRGATRLPGLTLNRAAEQRIRLRLTTQRDLLKDQMQQSSRVMSHFLDVARLVFWQKIRMQ